MLAGGAARAAAGCDLAAFRTFSAPAHNPRNGRRPALGGLAGPGGGGERSIRVATAGGRGGRHHVRGI